MPTPYTDVYDVFRSKYDNPIFNNLISAEDLQERYLISASTRFRGSMKDLSDRDSIDKSFNQTLSDTEKEILGNLMVIEYLNPLINNLQIIRQSISNKDWNLTSQANHLKELLNLRSEIRKDTEKFMTQYGYDFGDMEKLK